MAKRKRVGDSETKEKTGVGQTGDFGLLVHLSRLGILYITFIIYVFVTDESGLSAKGIDIGRYGECDFLRNPQKPRL